MHACASYDVHKSQILEYLVDAGGRALRTTIQKELGIPKASIHAFVSVLSLAHSYK